MSQETLDKKEAEIKSYFKDIINGYVAHDIKTLLDQSFNLDKREKGGCAAPLAMSIFSAIIN